MYSPDFHFKGDAMKEKQQFWKDLKSGKFANMVKESSRGQQINNPQDVFNIMKPVFAENDDVEQIWCIYLDTKNRIIATEKAFSGTIGQTTVFPREIVKRIIALKASALIMVHQHPSGDPSPSSEDKDITSRLWVALRSMQVTFHDHIIVGDGFYSFSDEGFLDSLDSEFRQFLRIRNIK